MNKERLLKLAAILDKVPRKHFDIQTYFHGDVAQPHQCGTTACAMGYAALDRGFKRAGLKLVKREYNAGEYTVRYGIDEGVTVAKKFFQIDYNEADSLFGGMGYLYGRDSYAVTPKMVARKIRKLVAKGQL